MAKGDRVAIMAPNLLQYPVALFGILRAGMTVVNVNPLYTPRELEHQLKDLGAKAIVILENFAHTLQEVLAETPVEHVITTQVGDLLPMPKRWIVNLVIKRVKKMVPAWRIDGAIPFRAALARGAAAPLKPVGVAHDDIAFLQYTGGTTGVAKGAMLTHRNILANLEQTGVWVSGSFKEGAEIVIAPLPMYHIFCLTSTLSFMKWGSLIVLITNPRDMPGFVKELSAWKWSVMTGVNTLFNGLMNTPGFDQLEFSALKVVVGGGAAVQKAVAERWQQLTGHCVTEAYGLTESSPGVCANPLGTPWNGTHRPSPAFDGRIDPRRQLQRAAGLERRGRHRQAHRRALRPGPAGDEGLLEPSRGNRQGNAGRLAEDRRRRLSECRGLRHDHRPEEGHDPGLRLQRLSERNRERGDDASGRARMRRGGRS